MLFSSNDQITELGQCHSNYNTRACMHFLTSCWRTELKDKTKQHGMYHRLDINHDKMIK
jgi:hypothetical protein